MFPGEGLREAIKIPQLWCCMGEELSETWSLSGFPWESKKKKMTPVWLPQGKKLRKLAGDVSFPSPRLDMPAFSLYISNVVMGQLVKCAGWLIEWLAESRKWAETKPFVGYEVAKQPEPGFVMSSVKTVISKDVGDLAFPSLKWSTHGSLGILTDHCGWGKALIWPYPIGYTW